LDEGDGDAAADSEVGEGPGGAPEAVFDASDVDREEEVPEDDSVEEDSLAVISFSDVFLGVGIRGTFFTSIIFLTSKTLFSAAAAFSAALVATACCSKLALCAGSSL